MFKVGDWVRFENRNIKAIKKVTEIMLDTYNGLLKEHTTLWQPKEGEWVWSKKRNELTNNVCELVKFYWDNEKIGECEPFIGELPSFLK